MRLKNRQVPSCIMVMSKGSVQMGYNRSIAYLIFKSTILV